MPIDCPENTSAPSPMLRNGTATASRMKTKFDIDELALMYCYLDATEQHPTAAIGRLWKLK